MHQGCFFFTYRGHSIRIVVVTEDTVLDDDIVERRLCSKDAVVDDEITRFIRERIVFKDTFVEDNGLAVVRADGALQVASAIAVSLKYPCTVFSHGSWVLEQIIKVHHRLNSARRHLVVRRESTATRRKIKEQQADRALVDLTLWCIG